MSCVILFCLICFATVGAQDCKVAGKKCADHEQCCVGCCVAGQCLDNPAYTTIRYDVCKDHSCRGEENCVVYTPPNCPGCEPLALCQITN